MDTKRPLVSICIPCHNAGRWITETVQSALAQTCRSLEVIVVDDGSTDDSVERLEAFGSRIRVEACPKRGPNTARNRLLELARGEWVQYLDADDYLQPHKIAAQVEAAQEEINGRVDVVYSAVLVEEWEDGKPRPVHPTFIDPGLDIYSRWFAWQLPQTGGALWRREAIVRAGGWHEAPAGEVPCCEHDLYARALRAGMRFAHCEQPGAVYRIWSSSTLCNKSPLGIIRTKNRLFDEMISWMKEQHLWSEQHRRTAGEACFRMARQWAIYDLDEAANYFARRKNEGLISVEGVAAPRLYRVALGLAGFRNAEKLAARRRSEVAASSVSV